MARKKVTRKSSRRGRNASAEATLWRGLLLIVGLLLAVWGGSMLLRSNGTASDDAKAAPVVGAPAPDFTAQTLGGQSLHLKALRGKPVVLNFWATWCPPCRAEMPMLQQYYAKHQNDYYMVAVNDAEPQAQVQAFIDQNGFSFTVVLDPQRTIVGKYRIQGFPTTFFIDAKGVIRYMHVGMLDETTLKAGLQSIGITP